MLMPALNKARMAGAKASCQSNEKSMGMAFSIYEGQYGRLPMSHWVVNASDNSKNWAWYSFLFGVRRIDDPSAWSNLGKDWKIMACPGDPRGAKSWCIQSYWGCRPTMGRLKADGTWQDLGNGNKQQNTIQGVLARSCRPPSRTLLVTDQAYSKDTRCDNPTGSFADSNNEWNQNNQSGFIHGGNYDMNANHRDGANHLFADGHVKYLDYKNTSNYRASYWSNHPDYKGVY